MTPSAGAMRWRGFTIAYSTAVRVLAVSVWSSVLAPGVVAAGVTLAFNWWVQRPRADLRMIRSGFTVTDLEWLKRARLNSSETDAGAGVMAGSIEKLAALARELVSLEPQQRRDVANKLRAFAVTAAEAPDGFLAAHVLDLVARFLD